MPEAQCQKCGAEFWREQNEAWNKLCYPCWRDKQEQEKQEQSQVAALRRSLSRLEDTLEERESLIASLDQLIEYQEQVIADLKARLAGTAPAAQPLPAPGLPSRPQPGPHRNGHRRHPGPTDLAKATGRTAGQSTASPLIAP